MIGEFVKRKGSGIPASTWVWHPELSNINTVDVGENGTIHSHVWIGNKVKIGDRVKVQAFCFIPDGVTIGNDCFLGPRVTFCNDKKPPSDNWTETFVEDGVSIGAGAVILPGLTLGKGCVIGAGAVVTHNVPPGETWVGNPASLLVKTGRILKLVRE